MDRKLAFLVVFCLLTGLALLGLGWSVPAQAAPLAQLTPFPTPTPGPDGRIMYEVQPGDTLWRIAAVSGISLEELREYNNLGTNEIIAPGRMLILGVGGPVQEVPTQGPPPTATSTLPTPTPGTGTGQICVLLYLDQDGDAIRQEEEPSIARGAININDRLGLVSINAETPAGGISASLFPEPEELGFSCFEVERGVYNVTVAIPDGYNATTVLNKAVSLDAGQELFLSFGAQPDAQTLAEAPTVIQGGQAKSPALAVFGGLFLLAGIGLGVYAALFSTRRR
ncbi:MAG: LysM peptidoglycan-binding domain-containing protein [Anaerolineales bacterium]|nr:LysM peptidoglycan-binding domain-containing protein [Anaerolineales bacterium]